MDAPQGTCTECNGTGFVVGTSEGRTAARRCVCRLSRRKQYRLEAARIPPRYRHCALSEFQALGAPLQRAHTIAERTVLEFRPGARENSRGILFHGPCGIGKTHLAVGILIGILENYPVTGLFAEFTDLLRRIQDTFDRRSETSSQAVLQPALEADVLVLDDLGCTRMTDWVRDTLGLIINERYNGNRMTIVTTNRPIEKRGNEESLADRIGERPASRLREMCSFIEMTGADFRTNIKADGADFRSR